MIPTDTTSRLRRTAAFADTSPRELALIAQRLTGHEAPAGEVLVRQGTSGREVFVITAGSASVRIDGHEVARLGPGAIFGEIALLEHRPRTATVVAIEDSRVEVGSPIELAELMVLSPSFRAAALHGLAQRAPRAKAARSSRGRPV